MLMQLCIGYEPEVMKNLEMFELKFLKLKLENIFD